MTRQRPRPGVPLSRDNVPPGPGAFRRRSLPARAAARCRPAPLAPIKENLTRFDLPGDQLLLDRRKGLGRHAGGGSPRPASRARRMAAERSVTWSLVRMFETWLRTVLPLTPSRRAIAGL